MRIMWVLEIYTLSEKRLNNKIVIMEYKPAKLITHN